MAGNSFGKIFQLTTFGESHGAGVGGILDGCPAGISLDTEQIQKELTRRRPGQSAYTTQRDENDKIEFLSGLFDGKTTGAPIAFLVRNTNQNSEDYRHLRDTYRPSHADYVYEKKYGFRDYRGGGRSSARETLARVAAGAIAKQVLAAKGIEIQAYVSSLGKIRLDKNYKELDLNKTELSPVRCPDEKIAEQMQQLIKETANRGDTLGGTVSCVVKSAPVGLGEPVFDKLHADLGKAMLSINAAKGFEYGSGFEGAKMNGSEHNDRFVSDNGDIKTATNHSGGVQGGISNGEDIYFRVAFKPIATVMQDQETVDNQGRKITLEGKGRHDVTVLPRAVPIVEAMAALVIADHLLRNQTGMLFK